MLIKYFKNDLFLLLFLFSCNDKIVKVKLLDSFIKSFLFFRKAVFFILQIRYSNITFFITSNKKSFLTCLKKKS